ncbi:uncharacterized protein LOC62_01G000065 [Vanrija pseudolonga]|uniref:Uncharacterized protein n=1 Tax=Vanrija pseudolonga TaxID=143232 RepID=A0AAF0XYW5_9TREE|nr:hypothetical protein LOC62_01G000065 [Vanrija pseudolonga]
MLFTTLLALSVTPATVLAAWGDACSITLSGGGSGYDIGLYGSFPDVSPLTPGTCVWTSECHLDDGTPGIYRPGGCPNDPADVQCCWTRNCLTVEANRCPGDETIMCAVYSNECWKVDTGRCPGGWNERFGLYKYTENGVVRKCDPPAVLPVRIPGSLGHTL